MRMKPCAIPVPATKNDERCQREHTVLHMLILVNLNCEPQHSHRVATRISSSGTPLPSWCPLPACAVGRVCRAAAHGASHPDGSRCGRVSSLVPAQEAAVRTTNYLPSYSVSGI